MTARIEGVPVHDLRTSMGFAPCGCSRLNLEMGCDHECYDERSFSDEDEDQVDDLGRNLCDGENGFPGRDHRGERQRRHHHEVLAKDDIPF